MISTLRYFEWKNEMTSWKLVFLRFFFRHNDFSRVYKYTRVFCIRWKLSLNGIEIPFISSEFRFCAMCNSVRDIDWMQKRVRARQCCTLTLYVCIFKGFVDAHLFIKWNNVVWNRINRSSCVIYFEKIYWKSMQFIILYMYAIFVQIPQFAGSTDGLVFVIRSTVIKCKEKNDFRIFIWRVKLIRVFRCRLN